MDINQYRAYWEPVKSAALIKMAALRAHLAEARFPLSVMDPVIDEHSEEFKVVLPMQDAHDNPALFFEIILLDADENGADDEGVSLLARIETPNSLVLATYCPYNYTDDAFTPSLDDIEERLEQMDMSEVATALFDAVNNNPLVKTEHAEVYGNELLAPQPG